MESYCIYFFSNVGDIHPCCMCIKNLPFQCCLVLHQLIIPGVLIHCAADLLAVPSLRLLEIMLLRTLLYMCALCLGIYLGVELVGHSTHVY